MFVSFWNSNSFLVIIFSYSQRSDESWCLGILGAAEGAAGRTWVKGALVGRLAPLLDDDKAGDDDKRVT